MAGLEGLTRIGLGAQFPNFSDSQGVPLAELGPISRVNFFVGANNSGKSRLLRLLARQRTYRVCLKSPDLRSIASEVEAAKRQLLEVLQRGSLRSVEGLTPAALAQVKVPDYLATGDASYANVRKFFQAVLELPNKQSRQFEPLSQGARIPDGSVMNTAVFLARIAEHALCILAEPEPFQIPTRVYIPTLRGLRPPGGEAQNDSHAERTMSDYFTALDKDCVAPEVFTGLTMYEQVRCLLLGDRQEREKIKRYQEFLGTTFFEGQEVTLIPHRATNRILHVKIGAEAERPIHELGDGIQSAIILSFLPSTTEDTFFFIEEPEQHMHPGLQRKILDFFAAQKRHHFFITTHSNHMLDLSVDLADVSIFNFRKHLPPGEAEDRIPTTEVIPVSHGDQRTLELLGVRNSSVFLVNSTIWVEGITDRLYLRQFLKLYQGTLERKDRYEEDVHFAFVEYGGSNITHWSFLDGEKLPQVNVDRLCAKMMVIVDEDGGKKQARKDALAAKLKDRFVVLPVREIENGLPARVVLDVLRELEKNATLVVPELVFEGYQSEYLGKFLAEKGGGMLKRRYQEPSGTLKGKVTFCELALPRLTQYAEIPDPMKKVVAQMHSFIASCNSRA